MFEWNNKVVWITGASSGIGRALALRLSEKGCSLILSARNRAGLEETASMTGGGASVELLPLDISDIGDLSAAAGKAEALFGHIDILINNAGMSQRSLLTETDTDVMKRLMEVNFTGPAVLTRHIVPGMVKRGAGIVVGVSSITGKFGSPLRTVYSAAKHALHGFYDSLRAEVSPRGLQVTVAVPGFINTEISRHAVTGSGDFYDSMDSNQAQGISADHCARDILRGIEKKRLEVYTGLDFRARLALFLQKTFPSVLARILSGADVT